MKFIPDTIQLLKSYHFIVFPNCIKIDRMVSNHLTCCSLHWFKNITKDPFSIFSHAYWINYWCYSHDRHYSLHIYSFKLVDNCWNEKCDFKISYVTTAKDRLQYPGVLLPIKKSWQTKLNKIVLIHPRGGPKCSHEPQVLYG